MTDTQAGGPPDAPRLEGLEQRWTDRWEADDTYRFDPTRPKDEVFAIDTPPPTVSGRLHIGSACSYTHTDLIARYRRMRGVEVFYPMGWDDNSLNVERRAQLTYGVVCDPTLPYDPDVDPPGPDATEPVAVSRRRFVELCEEMTSALEVDYRDLWRRVGLSVDWSRTYTTIGPRAQRVSQLAFRALATSGDARLSEAPTLWDVDYATAVALAEVEERERSGAYHRLAFDHPEGGTVAVDTTRPELLPACVALVCHPDDDRHTDLVGTEVTSPLFAVPVPVHAHHLADPQKGTGIAMVCTFGDTVDVTWWRDLDLPLRPVIGRDGRLRPVRFGEQGWPSEDPDGANAVYDELDGLTVTAARRRIAALLAEAGRLLDEPRPVTHAVKYWENGDRPLETVTSWQWFIDVRSLADELIGRGRQIDWRPPGMRRRYEDWVEGLTADWNISRQRYFGVPFPVWYPIDEHGRTDRSRPLLADPDRLPVDPQTDVPDGFVAEQRDRPDGFTAETDVMDTWATSSLSPQIAGDWPDDPELFERVFPMDLRPQAHDIIRTWLFYTVVRSHLLHDELPWRTAAISGFVVDPDRRKLSKSSANDPDAPEQLLDEYGADAVRYWAARTALGKDTTVDRNTLRIGRRLATKLLHASRFVLLTAVGDAVGDSVGEPGGGDVITAPLDRSLLADLATVVEEATATLDVYEHAEALRTIETAFWSFCDTYLELVKDRAYGDLGHAGAASARAALRTALSVFQRLLAPYLPFAAEESWSWWQPGSVHRGPWPETAALRAAADGAGCLPLEVATDAIAAVRAAKSGAGVALRTPVELLSVRDTRDRLAALELVADDLTAAGNLRALETAEADAAAATTEVRLPTDAGDPEDAGDAGGA